MAWTFERYLIHPRIDTNSPTICVGYGGTPNVALTEPKGSFAIVRDAATADLIVYLNTDGSTTWVVMAKPLASAWYYDTISAPAADDASGVHASNTDDTQTWPGPITSPVVPRNPTITFGAAWAGGNVTITGTDQFDAALTETIVASAGNRVDGVKTFKTITGITHASAGPGGAGHGATAGWGHKFGIDQSLAAPIGLLSVDGATESAVWDDTYNAFTPTNLPDGSRDFTWAVPT